MSKKLLKEIFTEHASNPDLIAFKEIREGTLSLRKKLGALSTRRDELAAVRSEARQAAFTNFESKAFAQFVKAEREYLDFDKCLNEVISQSSESIGSTEAGLDAADVLLAALTFTRQKLAEKIAAIEKSICEHAATCGLGSGEHPGVVDLKLKLARFDSAIAHADAFVHRSADENPWPKHAPLLQDYV